MATVRELQDEATAVSSKVKVRLLPIFVLVCIVNYLDRGNIGYAAEELKAKLGLDDVGYGAAAGALFYTYVLFQWPHTLIAARLGVRRWLAFVVALWGTATLLTAWVQATWQLLLLRLVVGFAEAGCFPLFYMHLDSFLTDKEVALCWSIIISASQVASIISGPLAASLIQLPATALVSEGWQWLFVVEGGVAIMTAVVVLVGVTDGFQTTTFLSPREKDILMQAKAGYADGDEAVSGRGDEEAGIATKETKGKTRRERCSSGGILDWKAWYLGVVSFFISTPVYAFMFFSPLLIRTILGPGASQGEVDALNGVPYLCAALLMLLVGRTIKIFSERLYHGMLGMSLAAALAFAFPAVYSLGSAGGAFVHMSILYGVTAAVYIPMDTMPSAYCTESAGSYSLLNSIKSISGIVGPALFGAVKQSMGGPVAIAVLGCCEVVGLLMFFLFFVFIGDARAALSCQYRKHAKDEER